MSTNTQTTDHLEITNLFARYAHLLDEKRWDDIHTVFAPDIRVHSPRTRTQGLADVTDFIRRTEVDGEHTQHTTTDLLITVTGDQATTAANSLVYFFRAGESPHQTSGLRQTSTLTRTPEGWRINEIRIHLAWTRKD
ncbi:nuclear transport factor 2 family protein [Nocardia huaxiensis]|uniref:Nuclear transport factor 2 family protein n=1 Tax=Nocardia huaxiensis TaxID=2755382 RepID=A0A7D6Z975_9NOCA|nr:nuclear transport factor 2 family protein [Nocardia huaxiensis]QLY30068.1 nuclear transport factor 2 family protein [Nocardia huaxiensis]